MSPATDLSTLIEGFHLYCIAEGKRSTTIRWYLSKIRVFLQYLTANDLLMSSI